MEKQTEKKVKLSKAQKVMGSILGFLIVLLALVIVISVSMSDQNKVDKKETYKPGKADVTVMAESFVKKQLKAPDTAEFDYSKERVVEMKAWNKKHEGKMKFKVTGPVDAENSFGAKLRKTFVVIMVVDLHKDSSKNTWTLKHLEFR